MACSELSVVTSYTHRSTDPKNVDKTSITSPSVSVLKYLAMFLLAEGSGSSASSFCHVPCMMESNTAAISDSLNRGPVKQKYKVHA